MLRRHAGYVRGAGYLIVPKEPSADMVGASTEALDLEGIAHTGITRDRKHRVRLRHANIVGDAFTLRNAN